MSKCALQPITAFLYSRPQARFTTRLANCCKETQQKQQPHWKRVSTPIGQPGLDLPCPTILDCSVTLSSKPATQERLVACSMRRSRRPKRAATVAMRLNCIALKERWQNEKELSQRCSSSTLFGRWTPPRSRAVRDGSLGLRLA